MKIISSNEEKIIKKIKILYTNNKSVFSILPIFVVSEINKELKFDKQIVKLIDLTRDVDIFNKKDFLYVIKKKLNLT
ncbi:MAG: hypothetical protein IKG36_00500 [Mycoplasmataceae bacterium]|nr:hypothetical protein [Mycoplasmataceae bacterium]